MFIKANDKVYQLKFGLKSFIILEQFLSIDEQERKALKFYLALNDSSLTIEDAKNIMSQLDCDIDALLDDTLRESVGGSLDWTSAFSAKEQIEDLYQLAVGKIGMSPLDFFASTPHEIELIYKGFLERKELETNLSIIAKNKLISIFGDECKPSTKAKRDETFSSLGI